MLTSKSVKGCRLRHDDAPIMRAAKGKSRPVDGRIAPEDFLVETRISRPRRLPNTSAGRQRAKQRAMRRAKNRAR